MTNKETIEMDKIVLSDWPESPLMTSTTLTDMSLGQIRDVMTKAYKNKETEHYLEKLVTDWRNGNGHESPMLAIKNLLDEVRKIPHGIDRITQMNTIVSVLGRRKNLSCLLDMLVAATNSHVEEEQAIARQAKSVKMHSVYGWCGNTFLVESSGTPETGTHDCDPAIGELLGNNTSAWNLTVHVWQPNANYQGFPCLKQSVAPVVIEPPHSHPFDFSSAVVVGEMHQSIYAEDDAGTGKQGHYQNTDLFQVDGVWPPHQMEKRRNLSALEHRVKLTEGDSYYLPCDRVHDVEIDLSKASNTPTVTLFLSSEYMVMPYAFICEDMAKHHRLNTDLKEHARPISEEKWLEKLKALSNYLAGRSDTLDLNSIVRYDGSYAFLHTKLS